MPACARWSKARCSWSMWCSGGGAPCWYACRMAPDSSTCASSISRARSRKRLRVAHAALRGRSTSWSAGTGDGPSEYRQIRGVAEPLDDRLTPIYPLTEGQTQGRVRAMVNKALLRLAANPAQDLLPAQIVARLDLPSLSEALEFVHHPPVGTSLASLADGRHPAQRRLAFEELLAHQLSLRAAETAHTVRSCRRAHG